MTGTAIRMNWIVLVVLRMLNVEGCTLVSIMIVGVVRGNAIIVLVRTTGVMKTVTVAILPGVALIVKRDCS